MPSETLSVVVTRRLPEPVERRMQELFDVRLREDDTPMSREELAVAMQEADVLVPVITDRIDAGMIGQAGERLKLIANYGAGVDHIDVETARQRGILVSNTPGVLTDDTADMTMALAACPRGCRRCSRATGAAGRRRRFSADGSPGGGSASSVWGGSGRR